MSWSFVGDCQKAIRILDVKSETRSHLAAAILLWLRAAVKRRVACAERCTYGSQRRGSEIVRLRVASNSSANGSPMKSPTMQAKMRALGVEGSRGRPGVSNDNPYSESLFRALKC